MVNCLFHKIRTLGGGTETSPFERRRHEATNVFLFAVMCMIVSLNLVYLVTGAWVLWAANSSVVALMTLCFVALAKQRVFLSLAFFSW